MNNHYTKISSQLQDIADSQKSQQMSAYMLHQFNFLGVQAPERRVICKPFFTEMKKEKTINWDFVFQCWENPYREMQYVATDYLALMKKNLSIDDISNLEKLVVQKSWWDSVNNFYKLYSEIALKFSETNNILIQYSSSDNIWLRRVAICHQLLRKEKTDVLLLEQIILNNMGSNEFFINKAIGWALRDYSKTNPIWVKIFIENNKERLSKLSIREASKYL